MASLCCAPRCRPRAHRARASHCSARRREAARTNGCVLKGPVGCGSSSSSTVMYVSTRASIATTATLARAIQIGHDHKDLSSVERAMLGGERGGGYRHLIFLSVVCGEEDPSHYSGHSFPKPSKHFGAAAKSQDRTAAAAVRHFGANSHPQLLVPWRVACGGGELSAIDHVLPALSRSGAPARKLPSARPLDGTLALTWLELHSIRGPGTSGSRRLDNPMAPRILFLSRPRIQFPQPRWRRQNVVPVTFHLSTSRT